MPSNIPTVDETAEMAEVSGLRCVNLFQLPNGLWRANFHTVKRNQRDEREYFSIATGSCPSDALWKAYKVAKAEHKQLKETGKVKRNKRRKK